MKATCLAAMLCFTLWSGKASAQSNDSKQNPAKMKEFILLVRVPTTYSPEQAKAVNPKWDIVTNKWKADNDFVTSYVFPGESYVLSGAERSVKNEAVVSDNLRLVSSIILRSSSLEQAVEMAKSCPVLEYGGSIEVREIPPRR